LSGVKYLDNPRFAVSWEQDPETEISLEEAYQELSLILLPRAKALWESWFESGLLTIEEGTDGRHWRVDGATPHPDAGD
jgi:hypothetical protein